jgi:hypothetical protein
MNLRQKRWVSLALLLIFVTLSVYVLYRSGKGDLAPLLMVVGLALINIPWFQKFWKALSLRWKIGSISIVSGLFLFTCFLVNMHKHYARIDDDMCVLVLVSCFVLWAIYALMSRGLDALWFRITKRQ